MENWTDLELQYLDLGDCRRTARFGKIVEQLVKRPGSSVPKAMVNWYDTKATYNFWANDRVSETALIEAMGQAARDRCRDQEIVLVAHDTTNVTFTHDAEGLGYLDHGRGKGIMAHTSLAITVGAQVRGILNQLFWVRPVEQMGKKKTRAQRAFEDKESYRWWQGIEASDALLGADSKVVHLADREADIFDLFAFHKGSRSQLLIRATHNRALADGQKLWDKVGKQAVAGYSKHEVPRGQGRKGRQARLCIRYCPVSLKKPDYTKTQVDPSIDLWAILVQEEGCPKGQQAIEWKLLTTLPVLDKEQAMRYTRWYGLRWKIERFHYVLKSGCKVERLQLDTAQQLRKALITYSQVAWKIMWLVYESRINEHLPCTVVLEEHEWKVLYQHRYKTFKLPEQVPRLGEVLPWIARLGGYLDRNNDGPPGVKTTWEGLRRLEDMATLWRIMEKGSYEQF
jgi:hypothetical protein